MSLIDNAIYNIKNGYWPNWRKKEKKMKFYKLAFLYCSFNTGYSITAPLKWLIAVLGLGDAFNTGQLWNIVIGGIIYFLFCLAIGIPAYKFGWVDAVTEVSNRYNPLAKELRNSKIFKEENTGKSKIN